MRPLLLFLLLLAGALRAQEPAPLAYARDADTELLLEPTKGGKAWQAELRRFGSAREGQIVSFDSELKFVAENVWQFVFGFLVPEGEGYLRVRGQPGNDSILVETLGIAETVGKGESFGGSYRLLSPAERLARAKARFDASDAELNRAYQKARGELSKADAARLRDEQRDWLRHRDERGAWETHGAENAKDLPACWDGLLAETVNRIDFLRFRSGRAVVPGIAGEYADGWGGHLSLKETRGGIAFEVEAVRGFSAANGSLDGTAARRGDRAFFRERLTKDEAAERQPAELSFTFRGGHIVEVAGKNTGHHHGARAYFDGTYFKRAPLRPAAP